MSKKHLTSCGDCRHQMTGFDGCFFGLPVTCECRIFGETENRKSCRRFEKRMSREDLFERIRLLEKENDELKDKLDNIRREVINIDMFSDEALKHDIIAYREMHEFDNKDCYDIAWAIEKIGKECFR